MFEDLKYSIGEEFIYKDPEDEAEWRTRPTIFTITDIVYSFKADKIKIEFSWYNDSIDSGSGSVDLDEFENEYQILMS